MTLKDDEQGGLFDAPATAIASSDRIRGLLEQMQTMDAADSDRKAELARATAEMDPAVFRALIRDQQAAAKCDDDLAIAIEPAPVTEEPHTPPAVQMPTMPPRTWVQRAIVATFIAVYVALLLMMLV